MNTKLAIECLKTQRQFVDDMTKEALSMAIKALEAQEWVPVSEPERLPKKDGSYLVSGRWASGREAVGECEYKVHDGYFSTAWNFDVIAWRNLPEPYKAESEDTE